MTDNDPQIAADAAERVQAKLAAEGAAWLRARLRFIDEINANPDPDDDCPPTHINATIRLKPLPDGWMSVYGPEVDVNPDRLQALLDERDALLADRARMAAELEQAENQRDEAYMQLCGAQARIGYFESRAGAVHTMALLESEVGRLHAERRQLRDAVTVAAGLLHRLSGPGPCDYDGDGACRGHDGFASGYLEPCPHPPGRRFVEMWGSQPPTGLKDRLTEDGTSR